MFRPLLASLVIVALAGCQYGPLDQQLNQPELKDAVVVRDIVVTGRSVLHYYNNDNGSFGSFLCTIEHEVEGWASDELNDETCIGCGRTYSLGLRTVESDCDFGAGATADISFTPLSFFDQSSDASFWDWLEENEAVSYLNTTWYPRGPTEWTPRMGVFDGDWANEPDQDGQARACGAEVCAESRYWYGTSDWYGKWWLALDIDES